MKHKVKNIYCAGIGGKPRGHVALVNLGACRAASE